MKTYKFTIFNNEESNSSKNAKFMLCFFYVIAVISLSLSIILSQVTAIDLSFITSFLNKVAIFGLVVLIIHFIYLYLTSSYSPIPYFVWKRRLTSFVNRSSLFEKGNSVKFEIGFESKKTRITYRPTGNQRVRLIDLQELLSEQLTTFLANTTKEIWIVNDISTTRKDITIVYRHSDLERTISDDF